MKQGTGCHGEMVEVFACKKTYFKRTKNFEQYCGSGGSSFINIINFF